MNSQLVLPLQLLSVPVRLVPGLLDGLLQLPDEAGPEHISLPLHVSTPGSALAWPRRRLVTTHAHHFGIHLK